MGYNYTVSYISWPVPALRASRRAPAPLAAVRAPLRDSACDVAGWLGSAATAGPRCPRPRQRVVDQEDEAWPAVGRLPAVGWPIIEAAVALLPIIAELPMSLSIWG